MRISDWSSDVCSSDLGSQALPITLLSLDNKYRMIHICGGLVHGPRRPRGGHHSEQPEIKMEMIAPQAAAVPQAKASALLRRASTALVATVWANGILFCARTESGRVGNEGGRT